MRDAAALRIQFFCEQLILTFRRNRIGAFHREDAVVHPLPVIAAKLWQAVHAEPEQAAISELKAVMAFEFGEETVAARAFLESLLPHSPDVLSTIQIPCEWHAAPGATPVFDRYMDTLSGGCHAVENLLLEFMGAVFSNVKGQSCHGL